MPGPHKLVMAKSPSPSSTSSPSPSTSSTTTVATAATATATARDGDGDAKLLDPSSKLTAEIFATLTKALALREERLREETKRDEEELARLCDLLGLPEDPSERAGAQRLRLDGTPRGLAQVEMAADLLAEAIRRNKREGEAIVRETLELKRMTERVVGADKSLAAILDQLKLK